MNRQTTLRKIEALDDIVTARQMLVHHHRQRLEKALVRYPAYIVVSASLLSGIASGFLMQKLSNGRSGRVLKSTARRLATKQLTAGLL